MTNKKENQKELLDEIAEEVSKEISIQKESDDKEVVLGTMVLVDEDKDFLVYRDRETGEFSRKMKFNDISTVKAETKEQKLNLLKLKDKAIEFKKVIDSEITIGAIITETYSSLDKVTGNTEYGATTTIITPEMDKCYVTSSKTVYNKLINETFKMFGSDLFIKGEEITIIPVNEKGRDHDLTTFIYAD